MFTKAAYATSGNRIDWLLFLWCSALQPIGHRLLSHPFTWIKCLLSCPIPLAQLRQLKKIKLFRLFKKNFGGHHSFLWGHWYHSFGLLVTSAMGFKARVCSIVCMLHCLHAMNSSDSPLAQHLLTSWQPAWQPSLLDPRTCVQALVGLQSGIFYFQTVFRSKREPFSSHRDI